MIVAGGTHRRAERRHAGSGVAPQRFRELRKARFDVPLDEWNLVVKNVYWDRKPLGGSSRSRER